MPTSSELPSYHDTLERLRVYGMDPPDGAFGVVAAGGGEFPCLPQETIGQALMEVNENLALSTTHSADQPPVVLSNQANHVRGERNSTQPNNSRRQEGSHSEGSSTRSRRQRQNTKKINEYFDPVVRTEGSSEKVTYKCRRCDFEVTQQKQRERLFHLVLCSKVPFLTRSGLYMRCFDKDLPPLFYHPLHHISAATARRLVRTQHETMLSRLNCLQLMFDPSKEPRYARYLLEVDRVKKSTPIGNCSKEEHAVATDLLIDFIVDENMPFAICDNKDNFPRPFRRLISYLRPGYKLPSGYVVRTKLIDEHYATMKKDVSAKLRMLLQECRGTVMFDGSEDVNGAPMINVLVRVMGNSRGNTSTYFLTTVYTGYDTVDANYYVKMVEKVMGDFGGFEHIAGVVTDNTGSVKNAREELEKKYPRLVASQDQAHVADRLMADFGELPWIRAVHEKLSTISSILKRYRKLRAKMMEIMKEHNALVRRSETADNSGILQSGAPDRPELHTVGCNATPPEHDSRFEPVNLSEFRQDDGEVECFQLLRHTPEEETHLCEEFDCEDILIDNEGCTAEDFQDNDAEVERYAPAAQRTAVTMKKPSNVRFASREKLLDEYIRLRPVLLKLIDDPLFPTLFTARSGAERAKRDHVFIRVIRDEQFLVNVKQIHDIFRACRTYLRIFDAETCLASEVFEATRILKETLESLPLQSFPDPRPEKRQELLDIFENRRIGPLPGRKKIKICLLSDLHITAVLLDPFRTPMNAQEYMDAFHRHLWRYLSGLKMPTLSIDESQRDAFFAEIVDQYFDVRGIWMDKGLIRERSESTTKGPSDPKSFDGVRRSRNPIVWWSSGWVVKPVEPFRRKATEELIEFAIRTLSVSPTATATERTFSLENRIHSNQRANMSKDKVRKILFCQWNARVLRRSVRQDEIDIKWELERQKNGMKMLRSLRTAILSASKENSVATVPRPTSVDQNTSGVERQQESRLNRDTNVISGHSGDLDFLDPTEGSTVETQRAQQRVDTEPTTRLPSDSRSLQPSIQVRNVPETQQSVVSELLRTAIQTTLEYGFQPQSATTQRATNERNLQQNTPVLGTRDEAETSLEGGPKKKQRKDLE